MDSSSLPIITLRYKQGLLPFIAEKTLPNAKALREFDIML
jgi:hypothetical protein